MRVYINYRSINFIDLFFNENQTQRHGKYFSYENQTQNLVVNLVDNHILSIYKIVVCLNLQERNGFVLMEILENNIYENQKQHFENCMFL